MQKMDKSNQGLKCYRVTAYGVSGETPAIVQTVAIQRVIDLAASQGGGQIVFPFGCYLSGSLFFKPGTSLYLEENATILGSEDMSDYKLLQTRIEGETIHYFAALINADKVEHFSITGNGTLDGCGLKVWKNFWLRRSWNPNCLNIDEMRARLVYIPMQKIFCSTVCICAILLTGHVIYTVAAM